MGVPPERPVRQEGACATLPLFPNPDNLYRWLGLERSGEPRRPGDARQGVADALLPRRGQPRLRGQRLSGGGAPGPRRADGSRR